MTVKLFTDLQNREHSSVQKSRRLSEGGVILEAPSLVQNNQGGRRKGETDDLWRVFKGGWVGDPKTAAVVRWHYSLELSSMPANSVIIVCFSETAVGKMPTLAADAHTGTMKSDISFRKCKKNCVIAVIHRLRL